MKGKHLKQKRMVKLVYHYKMVPDEKYHDTVRKLLRSITNIEKKEVFDSKEFMEELRGFKETCFPHTFNGVPIDVK